MRRETLVVFEGAEGVGKTTQVRRLLAYLAAQEIPYLHQREPGGTSAAGEVIRELLLDPDRAWTPAAEALLFMASRAQLVKNKIEPALQQGQLVVLDRFFLSTYAYQIAGRGLSEADVRAANRLAVGELVPSVTLLLDLPVEQGLARAGARGPHDRMQQAGDDFHHRVGQAFQEFLKPEWQFSHPECGPLLRIDASGSEEDVFARVLCALAKVRPETFGGSGESK